MLTNANYFSPENSWKYMSVSQFKAFLECEGAALAELHGEYIRPLTEALLVGLYVDAWFEGTLDDFIAAHSDQILTRSGTLKKPYQHADYIINRLQRSGKFMQYMSGEKQRIFTGEIEGVPFKIKIDSYLPKMNIITDLKVVRDFELIYDPVVRKKLHFIDAWRYDLQGAAYREIVRQNTDKTMQFYIAAATKEPEPNHEVFWVPDYTLDGALDEIKSLIPRFQRIKNGELQPTRCEKCAYCRRTKVIERPINYREVYNFDAENIDR